MFKDLGAKCPLSSYLFVVYFVRVPKTSCKINQTSQSVSTSHIQEIHRIAHLLIPVAHLSMSQAHLIHPIAHLINPEVHTTYHVVHMNKTEAHMII